MNLVLEKHIVILNIIIHDKGYRPTFATQIDNMADINIQELQNEFDRAKNSILQNLDFYDTQIAFKGKMQEVLMKKIILIQHFP